MAGKPASAIAAWRPDTVQFAIGVALVCVTMFGADLGGNLYWIHIFRELGIFLSVSVLLNFLYVDAGQTSFGQGAVLGAGAYMAAVLTGLHGVPYPLAAVAGVLAAMAVGLLCALPALRVQTVLSRFRDVRRRFGVSRNDCRVPAIHRRHQRHPHAVSRAVTHVLRRRLGSSH